MVFVELRDIVTHYRVEGRGPLTVTFVHSLGGDLRIWDDVCATLSRSHPLRLLRYDLRGHGLTDATPPPYRLETFTGDLEAVLDACSISRTVLCGASLGGLIALQLAVSNPERVSGLVLSGAVAKLGDASYWKDRIATVRSKGITAIADGALERWFPPAFRAARGADLQGWRNMLIRTSHEGYLGACEALRDGDLRVAVRSLRVPTLVLAGSDDGVLTLEVVREFAQSIPGASFEILDGAGHLPCIEQPELMAEAMLAFIEEKLPD